MTEREEKVDRIAENVYLKLAGRLFMTVVGGLSIPVLVGFWSWAAATSSNLDDLQTRVVVLENNTTRGRQDREKFQEQTADQLQALISQVAQLNTTMAALTARIDAQQREMDRRGR